MLARILSAALIALSLALPAHADSTVNPNVPAAGAALQSAPIRNNFRAAYNDINKILGCFAGATSPASPTPLQFWCDNSAPPVVTVKQFDGSVWVTIWSINTSAHAFSFGNNVVLGANEVLSGSLGIANGNVGGATVTIQNPAATSAYNFNLPAAPGTAGQPLMSGGGGTSPMTFGTLGLAGGGTGGTSAATARTSLGLGSLAQQNANTVAITGGAITGMPNPSLSSDVATKDYVDASSAGLHVVPPSRLATTGPLPSAPTYTNLGRRRSAVGHGYHRARRRWRHAGGK
jgi:hypothetical protein